MYIYIHTYIYIHIYIYIWIYININIYIYTYKNIYIYIYIFIYIYICIYIYYFIMETLKCVVLCMCIYIYKYVYIFTRISSWSNKASFNSTIYLSIQVYTCTQVFAYVSYKYTIHTGAACQLWHLEHERCMQHPQHYTDCQRCPKQERLTGQSSLMTHATICQYTHFRLWWVWQWCCNLNNGKL